MSYSGLNKTDVPRDVSYRGKKGAEFGGLAAAAYFTAFGHVSEAVSGLFFGTEADILKLLYVAAGIITGAIIGSEAEDYIDKNNGNNMNRRC